MKNFAAQLPLFRAYDIRGARQYFTDEFIKALGAAFAHLYQSQDHLSTHSTNAPINTVVIGYDVRYNSDTISQTLANILHQQGLNVVQLGLITTPMMAFWAQQYDGHGIMVTASHSEKHTLGVKWLVDNTSPSSADIQAIFKTLGDISLSNTICSQHHKNNEHPSISPIISLPTHTVVATYINAITHVFTRIEQQNNKSNLPTRSTGAKLDLKIVIDCLNGATSKIAQPLFERFCQTVIMLNDTPDGTFPRGNPDPTETNRLAELQQTVIVNEADMGLAFDGDGDRLMIVDNDGKVVTPDHLLYLLAQVAMMERPILDEEWRAPEILFDVKCSHHLPRLLKKLDAIPVMSKTGSSLLRRQLQSLDNRAIFAGELSGHFIFNDDYFIVYDDALYAGLRLLHWLASTVIDSDMTALLGTNTDINTDSSTHMLLAKNDSWGTRRRSTLPYRLTDITQHLPNFVSTADNYLPLHHSAPTTCSIVDHLATLCHYLQHLVESAGVNSATARAKNLPLKASQTATSGTPLLCPCFETVQQMTANQAERLLPAGTRLSCIDGVRLDFTHGFGILRQSNTSHSLTVRFAGDNLADMKEVQAHFVALCRSFNEPIAAQIAAISAE